MDELARYNKERWEELAKAGVLFSRPKLNLNLQTARETVDPEGLMDDPARKDVLCLAGGGGKQTPAFALLGANVTVLDLSETQLERDLQAVDHYGLSVRTVQGDMRDLSCFEPDSFDIVYHAHSLNFVPDVGVVFDQVARVLRPGGQYRMDCWNPYAHGTFDQGWDGEGYRLAHPYVEGHEMTGDGFWDVVQDWQEPPAESSDRPANVRIRGPREFRHTIGTIVNGVIARGFTLLGLWESDRGNTDADPGTWDHFTAYAPPWLVLWARLGEEA